MELMNNELVCFAAICKHLSLTEASKELGKSKAQVSRQLAALEKQLGVTLVHRTTRKLVLTDHAKALESLPSKR